MAFGNQRPIDSSVDESPEDYGFSYVAHDTDDLWASTTGPPSPSDAGSTTM